MIKKITILFSLLLVSCSQNTESTNKYLDYSSKEDKLSGGVKIVQIETPSGIKEATIVNKPFYDPRKKITASSTV